MSHRAPRSSATVLFRVTRPMTVPNLMAKVQIPKTKFQKNSKSPSPNTRKPTSALYNPRDPKPQALSLDFGIFLDFGFWDLSFSWLLIHNPDDHPAHGTFV